MAIPALAKSFKQPMDPQDLVEYQTDSGDTLLDAGEVIDTFALVMGAEGTALGVSIRNDGDYVPVLTNGNQSIVMWFEVDPAHRSDAAFFDGVTIPISVLITTTNVPPRRRHRTVTLRVQAQ